MVSLAILREHSLDPGANMQNKLRPLLKEDYEVKEENIFHNSYYLRMEDFKDFKDFDEAQMELPENIVEFLSEVEHELVDQARVSKHGRISFFLDPWKMQEKKAP